MMIKTLAHEERQKYLQSISRKQKIQRNEDKNTVQFFNVLF